MKALKISIWKRSLLDGFKQTGWYKEDVKGFTFYLFNNSDTGGAVFQCGIEGTENEQIKPGEKLTIEIK